MMHGRGVPLKLRCHWVFGTAGTQIWHHEEAHASIMFQMLCDISWLCRYASSSFTHSAFTTQHRVFMGTPCSIHVAPPVGAMSELELNNCAETTWAHDTIIMMSKQSKRYSHSAWNKHSNSTKEISFAALSLSPPQFNPNMPPFKIGGIIHSFVYNAQYRGIYLWHTIATKIMDVLPKQTLTFPKSMNNTWTSSADTTFSISALYLGRAKTEYVEVHSQHKVHWLLVYRTRSLQVQECRHTDLVYVSNPL